MLAQRDELRHGTELARIDHVARERRPAAHDLVTGVEERLRETVDEPVRARPECHLLERDVVPLRQGDPEAVRAAVRIPVEIRRRRRERLERSRERPPGPSFDASLITRSSPSSRWTSSIGLPGWYGTRSASTGRTSRCVSSRVRPSGYLDSWSSSEPRLRQNSSAPPTAASCSFPSRTASISEPQATSRSALWPGRRRSENLSATTSPPNGQSGT